MRPLNLMRSKMKPILECLFYSAGVKEFKDLARKIDLFTSLWNGLLNTKKKLGRPHLCICAFIRNVPT